MSELLQVLQGTSAQPRGLFYSDGALVDLDAAAVPTLTKPDGSAGPASGTVTKVAATTGTYTFTLAATSTADPTLYDIAWTGSIGGQPQTITTQVEVLGNVLFPIADLRAMKVAGGTPFSTSATPLYTDTQLHDARAATLDELERILGFSPVPRFARETHTGDGRAWLFVDRRQPSRLLSVKVDGAAQTVADFDVSPERKLTWSAGTFPATRARNVTVEYVAGWARLQGEGPRMAQLMAAAALLPDGFQTTTTASFPDGSTYTYEPSETARGGYVRHTGIRVVDRWLNRHTGANLVVA